MKTLTVILTLSLACLTASAQNLPKLPKGSKIVKAKQDGVERYAQQMKATGGIIVEPDTGKGHVSVLNLQSRMSDADINLVIALIRGTDSGYAFRREAAPKIETNGNRYQAYADALKSKVLVIIVDEPNEPSLVVAPESGWAVMNVAALEKGLNSDESKKKFFIPRCRKEFIRAYCYACGAGGSNFKDNLMTITKTPDLDFCGEFIPADTKRTIQTVLHERGLEPQSFKTYLRACHEGTAPAPTNDVQKAIWDKVHEIPSKPLKIEYNEKRDKGK